MRKADMLKEYDDHDAVRTYLERYWRWYMTEFEKKCHSPGARREKALLDPTDHWSRRGFAEWEQADDEVRERLCMRLRRIRSERSEEDSRGHSRRRSGRQSVPMVWACRPDAARSPVLRVRL